MDTLLREAGEALYGHQWQSELSRVLGVADRTVRRWISGETPVPPGVAIDLRRLCLERANDLDALAEKLKTIS